MPGVLSALPFPRYRPCFGYRRGDCILRAVDAMKCGEALVRVTPSSFQVLQMRSKKLTRLFTQLIKMASAGQVPSCDDAGSHHEALRHQDFAGAGFADDIILTYRGRAIRPKTAGQKAYIDAIRSNTVSVLPGPAGYGQTYLAMAMAIAALKRREVSRTSSPGRSSRPERASWLSSGTLQEKIDPFIFVRYSMRCSIFTDMERANEHIERGTVEIAPFAYMRGAPERRLRFAFGRGPKHHARADEDVPDAPGL